MKICVAVKVVPDDQDIFVSADRSLDYSKTHEVVSEYDLNAIEAAAQLSEAHEGSSVIALSVSGAKADDAKVKKSILSRGVDELFMVADDEAVILDAHTTARVLKKLLEDKVGDFDIILCGDGSADMYAGQVDVQLAAALDIPVINAVTALRSEEGKVFVERTLDAEVEEIEIALPAVVSVSPEIALPRIAGMREILAAGKKPSTIACIADTGISLDSDIQVEEIKAPELAPRKNELFDSADEGALDAFAAAVIDVLR